MTLKIEIVPKGKRRYEVFFEGKLLCLSGDYPFATAAKIFQERGYPPTEYLEMYRPGDKEWALRGPLGAISMPEDVVNDE